MKSTQIGIDTSIDRADESTKFPSSAAVCVESHRGVVCITGPFEGWMGYQELADYETAEEGDALAARIVANPVAELTALGYSHEGWFQPMPDETAHLLAGANGARLLGSVDRLAS